MKVFITIEKDDDQLRAVRLVTAARKIEKSVRVYLVNRGKYDHELFYALKADGAVNTEEEAEKGAKKSRIL